MSTPAPKTCATCGREIEWRKKWARDWNEVRYCSKRCRYQKPSAVDRELEEAILSLLEARGRSQTICPSEAARKVRPDDWRGWMERTRQAARRLVEQGAVEIVQRGQVVDASRARGPIRIRRT